MSTIRDEGRETTQESGDEGSTGDSRFRRVELQMTKDEGRRDGKDVSGVKIHVDKGLRQHCCNPYRYGLWVGFIVEDKVGVNGFHGASIPTMMISKRRSDSILVKMVMR
ncbi:hypothetical protein E3N88_25384 [Mikania micrantha]|uniref:Uncharacterized protein n=1 Tax=Mikania micrantha TaxID=192012 RepID=A0A5N6N610_9ASTR|nr:hypothetical protein E3N88_25384 [Mikania micrantha]